MHNMTDAVGASDIFLAFQEQLRQITDSERPVLILGERGTGKELAAQRLHYLSRRWEKPCVTLLCPALSPSLLESELFGHEAGAFTGARERRIGYIERADGGSLFLDEVADMPPAVQDKLLRVLEYGEFVRVGGSRVIRVDVRVIAATNRPLHMQSFQPCQTIQFGQLNQSSQLNQAGNVEQQGLRLDLLDRLACEVVHVPPLRLRGDDRLLLARYFATRLGVELGLPLGGEGVTLGAKAVRQLESYTWPGNVRELKNVIERSLIRTRATVLDELVLNPFRVPWDDENEGTKRNEEAKGNVGTEENERTEENVKDEFDCPLPLALAPVTLAAMPEPASSFSLPHILPPAFSLPKTIANIERQALKSALVAARFRQTEAARLLGLTYHQFRALYRKHN